MKKIFTAVFLFLTFVAEGQTPAVQTTIKYPFSIYKKIHNAANQNNLVSVLVEGDVERIAAEVENLGGKFKYAAGNIACVRIPVNKINALAQQRYVQRIEGSDEKIEVLNDKMILNNNVYLVHQGFNLPQGYDGEGVVVGVIDEGIDVAHKDLRDEQGRTRIKWLWDQRLGINSHTPAPYGYGQSFTAAQIDNLEAVEVVDHNYSHGTHVTGTAAGNGLAVNNYKGVAPKSDIIFVAVSTATSDDNFLTNLVDAVQYIYERADSLGKPCVINISLGTYFGSHDGLDLQAKAIDFLIAEKNGRFISAAAGNEGAAPIHYQNEVSPDSSFIWLGGYTSKQSLYLQLWADSADLKNVEWMVGADKTTPAYMYRGGTPFKFATAKLGYDSASVYGGLNRIGRVESYVWYSFGRYSMELLITPDSANYRWRFMTRGTGKIDAWSFDFVPAAIPDSASYPIVSKYKYPDTDQTIVSSFTCSPKVMTVGSYVNRTSYADMNMQIQIDTAHVVGALSDFSSHGPTRDGRIKPEITASGQWVLSCAALYDLQSLYAFVPSYVGAGSQHRLGTGTSMASPVVAGIAALYLQKNPNASYQEVKDAIIACTKTDQFTGNVLPDNKWGFGKIDAYKVLKGCSVGVNEQDAYINIVFGNFPNPFSNFTTIHYDLTGYTKAGKVSLSITDAVGKQVRALVLESPAGDVVVNKNDLGSGIYFYSLVLDGKIVRTNKLIVM